MLEADSSSDIPPADASGSQASRQPSSADKKKRKAEDEEDEIEVEADASKSQATYDALQKDHKEDKDENGEDGEQEEKEGGEDGEGKDLLAMVGSPTQQDEDDEEDRLADARTKFLLSQLTPEQQQRYEYFRRSGFQRSAIKRIMQGVANTPISQTMAIVMAGISKVYVGELVEMARSVMEEWGEPPGPLRPVHVREAYRRLKQTSAAPPPAKYTKRLFRR